MPPQRDLAIKTRIGTTSGDIAWIPQSDIGVADGDAYGQELRA